MLLDSGIAWPIYGNHVGADDGRPGENRCALSAAAYEVGDKCCRGPEVRDPNAGVDGIVALRPVAAEPALQDAAG